MPTGWGHTVYTEADAVCGPGEVMVGLHGQTDPGANKLSPCDLVVEATPEGFVTPDNFKPTDGLFDCSPDNVIPLKGDYGTGVTLESAGKTMADLE